MIFRRFFFEGLIWLFTMCSYCNEQFLCRRPTPNLGNIWLSRLHPAPNLFCQVLW